MRREHINVQDIKVGPPRHEFLSPDLVARIRAIVAWRQDYLAMPLRETIRDFLHDTHPEREVEVWECIGAGMETTVGLPFPQRQAIFEALLAWSVGDAQSAARCLVSAGVAFNVMDTAQRAALARQASFQNDNPGDAS